MTNPSLPYSIDERLSVVRARWQRYLAEGLFEQFVEFAIAVDSLAEHFNRIRLPGLARLCEGLENAVLAMLGDETAHPVGRNDIHALQRQMDTLAGSVETLRRPAPERRADESGAGPLELDWIKPRAVWIVAAPERRDVVEELRRQLQFFGFDIAEIGWGSPEVPDGIPLAVLFIAARECAAPRECAHISAIRSLCPASQLIYLGAQSAMDPIVGLMRAGIDVAIPAGEQPSIVLNYVLDLVQTNEQEQYRVLIVEDSRVAVALIRRTLSHHGIDTLAIRDPGMLLDVLESYGPDLVLMDVYMPRFNGVEATRVLRQMSAYSSLPILYLSGESKVGMQVEALRLGGDQFLMKPFNPVLLAAVVKTRIERFRETRRSARNDGLTGLLNHTAAKSRLQAMVGQRAASGKLTVAMVDIDYFKSINDTYGHPVGDQVIRGLAWLLKGRLRSIDLIGRYGGEEFIIALPDVDLTQARSVIDRIRSDFSALPHAHPGGALYSTFSAGLASLPLFNTAADLTEAADRALMEAKRRGRNRVEAAEFGKNADGARFASFPE